MIIVIGNSQTNGGVWVRVPITTPDLIISIILLVELRLRV